MMLGTPLSICQVVSEYVHSVIFRVCNGYLEFSRQIPFGSFHHKQVLTTTLSGPSFRDGILYYIDGTGNIPISDRVDGQGNS